MLLIMETSVRAVCTFSNFFGLQIVQIWSINYALHFGSAKIHKHCLYSNVFSTGIYTKIIFNCLLLFKIFLLVSKLFESVKSVNSTIFFCYARKLRQGLYLRALSIVIYAKLNSNFPVLF